MSATYGPHNPFRHAQNEQAWWDSEPKIMVTPMGILPSLFVKKTLKARGTIVSELKSYFKHTVGALSFFLQLRLQHDTVYGMNRDDKAHTELG